MCFGRAREGKGPEIRRSAVGGGRRGRGVMMCSYLAEKAGGEGERRRGADGVDEEGEDVLDMVEGVARVERGVDN